MYSAGTVLRRRPRTDGTRICAASARDKPHGLSLFCEVSETLALLQCRRRRHILTKYYCVGMGCPLPPFPRLQTAIRIHPPRQPHNETSRTSRTLQSETHIYKYANTLGQEACIHIDLNAFLYTVKLKHSTTQLGVQENTYSKIECVCFGERRRVVLFEDMLVVYIACDKRQLDDNVDDKMCTVESVCLLRLTTQIKKASSAQTSELELAGFCGVCCLVVHNIVHCIGKRFASDTCAPSTHLFRRLLRTRSVILRNLRTVRTFVTDVL